VTSQRTKDITLVRLKRCFENGHSVPMAFAPPRPAHRASPVPSAPALARDLQVDALRGFAMVLVVVNHTELTSALYFVTKERVGVVTGAEIFVAMSGFVLGMLYRRRIAAMGLRRASLKLWQRSRKLYLASVGLVTTMWLLREAGLDTSAVTTYTEQSTGEVYDLYANSGAADLVLGILTLRLGPGEFNVMGLIVVLVALTPLALWAMSRGATVKLLVVSWAIWAFWLSDPPRALPSQSENSFPLVLWQALFLLALALGYHRDRIAALARSPAARPMAVLVAALFVIGLFYTWNNPSIAPGGASLGIISEDAFNDVYARFFQRTQLGIGRIVSTVVVLIVLYALLLRVRPLWRSVAWFLVPFGQATFYVFILHVPLIVLVHAAASELGGRNGVVVNTTLQLVALMLLWCMVKRRVLFSIVPR